MRRKVFGFTLIELIIVIVIIGILALVALPRYFANIEKARRAKIYAELAAAREAIMGFHASNGAYPTSAQFTNPFTVTIDGDNVINVDTTGMTYTASTSVAKASSTGCTYTQTLTTGAVTCAAGGTCTCPGGGT